MTSGKACRLCHVSLESNYGELISGSEYVWSTMEGRTIRKKCRKCQHESRYNLLISNRARLCQRKAYCSRMRLSIFFSNNTPQSFIFRKEPNIPTLTPQIHQPLPHLQRPIPHLHVQPPKIVLLRPLSHAMLQHIPRPLPACRHRSNTPMQRHPLLPTIIHTPMQDIVIVKRNLSSLQIHRDLPRHIGLIWISRPLSVRSRAPVAPRDKE